MTSKEILLLMASKEDLLRAANLRLHPASLTGAIIAGTGHDIALAIALAEDITGSEIIELAKTH